MHWTQIWGTEGLGCMCRQLAIHTHTHRHAGSQAPAAEVSPPAPNPATTLSTLKQQDEAAGEEVLFSQGVGGGLGPQRSSGGGGTLGSLPT